MNGYQVKMVISKQAMSTLVNRGVDIEGMPTNGATISVDEERARELIESLPEGVRKLFIAAFNEAGQAIDAFSAGFEKHNKSRGKSAIVKPVKGIHGAEFVFVRVGGPDMAV